MQSRILEQLKRIETEAGVRILVAIESGSRGWGFPSPDSDYDVRFIYVRPRDCYLTLHPGRDTLEFPISDLLDIGGWDLQKTLRLAQKSNAVLWEWLQSPIIYRESGNFRAEIRSVIDPFFSPKTACYHYLSIAKRNWLDMAAGAGIKLKKYFYVLRPLLAAVWIAEHAAVPPMEFRPLYEAPHIPGPVQGYLQSLVAEKATVDESHRQSRHPQLDEFVAAHLASLEERAEALPARKGDIEQLNRFFRERLES